MRILKLAVHFGAGNIGRGFIGKVLCDSGYKVVFVDLNESVIQQINEDHSYPVEILDNPKRMEFVNNVAALNLIKEKKEIFDIIVHADLITTSVGIQNFESISKFLREALVNRSNYNSTKINILANENAINASSKLKDLIYSCLGDGDKRLFDQNYRFVNTAIDRQSLSRIENKKSIAVVEPYFEWLIDGSSWYGEENKIDGATYVDDLKPFIERKLYLVNGAHAAIAYLANLSHYQTVQNALNDEHIVYTVNGFLDENLTYFVENYQMDRKDLKEFVEKTLRRFSNPQLSDDVSRVGRSPIRKLGMNERIVTVPNWLSIHEYPVQFGVKVIAAVYCFKNENDEEAKLLQEYIRSNGVSSAIDKYSGIDSKLKTKVVKQIELYKGDFEDVK